MGDARQRQKLDYLANLNRRHAETRSEQTELDARIKSYELAFRMQAEAPEAIDLAKESKETQSLYGIGEKETDGSASSACWPAGWWSGGCGSCNCTTGPAASGTPTKIWTRATAGCARAWTNPSPGCWLTSSGPACWTARWWCGAGVRPHPAERAG